jgi:hypothetical protein
MKMLQFILLSVFLSSCSDHAIGPGTHNEIGAAVAAHSIAGNDTSKAGPTSATSGGGNTLGVTGPSAEAAVGRIANGFEGNTPPTQGNFSQAIASVKSNLPKVTNVNSASGYDQVELLAYAACADLVDGGQISSVYGVQGSQSVTSQQAALVAAGVRILDNHTANLASQGPNAAAVATALTNLVTLEATNAANSKMAFMTVCIAASTAGSTLLGM